ncbi:MAG: 2-methylisocitrate lyase-like PEP mutase family enzyme [Gammaproteobacteria bacterium]|jgi:2-methylisocitrate lyase-like PEP mutase family enzyme
MSQGRQLKALMAKEDLVIAPGAYDGLTAKLIRQADFSCVYMTGGGTSCAHGYPDYGLLSVSEMVDNAGRIADAVDVPVISDADNGYGNELNVFRTIRAFEKAGVAAVHIEDQAFPKRCGHLEDKELISIDDYIAKIRAAVDARRDPDFMIIARTDARASLGFEEAVRRCNSALAAGADIAFLEAPQTIEEMRAAPKKISGPCLLNVVQGGKTPDVAFPDVKEMGYKIAIVPGLLFIQVIGACDQALAAMKREQRHPQLLVDMSPAAAFARAGAGQWDPRRDKYRTPVAADAAE